MLLRGRTLAWHAQALGWIHSIVQQTNKEKYKNQQGQKIKGFKIVTTLLKRNAVGKMCPIR